MFNFDLTVSRKLLPKTLLPVTTVSYRRTPDWAVCPTFSKYFYRISSLRTVKFVVRGISSVVGCSGYTGHGAINPLVFAFSTPNRMLLVLFLEFISLLRNLLHRHCPKRLIMLRTTVGCVANPCIRLRAQAGRARTITLAMSIE